MISPKHNKASTEMGEGRKGGDGELVMRYANGLEARIKVPAEAICEHKAIRVICKQCKPITDSQR